MKVPIFPSPIFRLVDAEFEQKRTFFPHGKGGTMKYIAFTFSALLLSLFVTGPARSYDLDHTVVVADRMIHPVRASAGGYSAEQRVARINERLVNIIAKEPLNPANIRLRMVSDDPGIFVGRHLVTTITQADADANNTTKMQLAQIWLRRYKRVLPDARPDMNWGVKHRESMRHGMNDRYR
jgi:hypothetical protein